MLVPAIAAFFRHKAVRSIFILACWHPFGQNQFIREISKYGFAATFACDPAALRHAHRYGVQGVLYFKQLDNDDVLRKVYSKHFSNNYVWLIVGDDIPAELSGVRYDADMALLRTPPPGNDTSAVFSSEKYHLEDIYVHPRAGTSAHPWAYWAHTTGLQVVYDWDRTQRRLDLKGYPLQIAVPLGEYSADWYNGTNSEFGFDEKLYVPNSSIRCGYVASVLLVKAVKATEVIKLVNLWGSSVHNDSVLMELFYESSELGGAVMRILPERLDLADFVMPIWEFHVGFTYLGERKSSSNMFVEPFTAAVWWTCLGVVLVLAAVLRLTANSPQEKDDCNCAVLATFLQQDASSVPQGISGRWTFVVLSVFAMLVHAYYTSAIVSALMSAGNGGPESLRALADSKYEIASEDYQFMRYLLFDIVTTWDDLEYLKRKKKIAKFYQVIDRGVELIQEGNTAYHTEYNQIFPYFKKFTDAQLCRLQYIDTIPKINTWITASLRGQYTNIFRTVSSWLNEVGLGKRVVNRLQAPRPECRSAMLAERVKFGDVALLSALTVFGAFLSFVILALEILVSRYTGKKQSKRLLSASGSEDTLKVDDIEEY